MAPLAARTQGCNIAKSFTRRQLTTRSLGGDNFVGLLAAGEPVARALAPIVADLKALNLPEPLIKYGHPGNMAVVLVAMGGYGAVYKGWQIRLASDPAVKAAAKKLHPPVAIGMTIFFALGALGGTQSLLMQDKDIFESGHVLTAIFGLLLLLFQGMLSLLFRAAPQLRNVHAYVGSATMLLFLVHAAQGV